MPWIILMTDRRRLGDPICALSRAKKGAGRRTHLLRRAMLFPTNRKARDHIKKVLGETPRFFFSTSEVELPEPRDPVEAHHREQELFP